MDEIKQYYPIIQDVRVMKSQRNEAIYMEIQGFQKSFATERSRDFLIPFLAENKRELQKLVTAHTGPQGIKPEYTIKQAGEDFDCIVNSTRTSWECLQGYLISKMEEDRPIEGFERLFEEDQLDRIFKILRKDVMDFYSLDNSHYPGSEYEHLILIKRLKGAISQLFPCLPEAVREDDNALFAVMNSAVNRLGLNQDLYQDADFWKVLCDRVVIRNVQEENYEFNRFDPFCGNMRKIKKSWKGQIKIGKGCLRIIRKSRIV